MLSIKRWGVPRSLNFCHVLVIPTILLGYLTVLHRYGTAIPAPMPPEEANLIQMAQNMSEGKGYVTQIPSEFFPFPETPQRMYVPVVSYVAGLSLWGKIWGFDLATMRWFNRIVGALNLILLFHLARQWGIPPGLAVLAVLWTSLDIVYQLVSNIVRADMFSLFWIQLGLLMFGTAWEQDKPVQWITSGICFAIALFAHLWLSFYITAWLVLVLIYGRRWKRLVGFALPSSVAALLWGVYIAQDWSGFIAQSQLMVRDKTSLDVVALLILATGITTLGNVLGAYPSNSPLWIALMLLTSWAGIRKHLSIKGWQWGVIWIAYLTGYLNRHPWYAGWFTPFGYLVLSLFGAQVIMPRVGAWRQRAVLIVLILWTGYQVWQVSRCWQAAPEIAEAHRQFVHDLAASLPDHGSIWLFSVPDPYLELRKTRPDLTLYMGTGYFHFPYQGFLNRLDGMVFVSEWVLPKSILPPYRVRKEWLLPAVRIKYSVLWVEPVP